MAQIFSISASFTDGVSFDYGLLMHLITAGASLARLAPPGIVAPEVEGYCAYCTAVYKGYCEYSSVLWVLNASVGTQGYCEQLKGTVSTQGQREYSRVLRTVSTRESRLPMGDAAICRRRYTAQQSASARRGSDGRACGSLRAVFCVIACFLAFAGLGNEVPRPPVRRRRWPAPASIGLPRARDVISQERRGSRLSVPGVSGRPDWTAVSTCEYSRVPASTRRIGG